MRIKMLEPQFSVEVGRSLFPGEVLEVADSQGETYVRLKLAQETKDAVAPAPDPHGDPFGLEGRRVPGSLTPVAFEGRTGLA